jgi:hypothetical protein
LLRSHDAERPLSLGLPRPSHRDLSPLLALSFYLDRLSEHAAATEDVAGHRILLIDLLPLNALPALLVLLALQVTET